MKISEVNRCDNCGGKMTKDYYVAVPNPNRLGTNCKHNAYSMAKCFNKSMIITKPVVSISLDDIYNANDPHIANFDADIAICANCIQLAKAPLVQVIATIRFNRGY